MSEVLLQIVVREYNGGDVEVYINGARLTEEPLRSMILAKAGVK